MFKHQLIRSSEHLSSSRKHHIRT